MNEVDAEVDKLYHEWRKEQRREAENWRRRLMDQNPRWYDEDPDYIRAQAVAAESKSLKDFIDRNKNEDDPEIEQRVKFAEAEITRRQMEYSKIAAKVRNAQLTTRGKTPLEQVLAQQEEINRGLTNLAKETLKTKGRKTMAQTTKTVKVNTKIDVAALVQAKMAEKMMDAVGDGKDIPLTKLTIMQSLANGGSIDVNELIRAKQTEKLLKDLNENKDLSIGKLMTYQALTSEDGFDINALIQAQFVEKLFAEDEKTK
jgi:hypothetical protein